MINPRHLKAYPIDSLDNKIIDIITQFEELQKSNSYKKNTAQSLALINMFCDVTDTKLTLIMLNDHEFRHHISKGIIGFIYTELACSEQHKHSLSHSFSRTFIFLNERCNLASPPRIKTSTVSITSDVNAAVEYYKRSFTGCDKRIAFYRGWVVEDNVGNKHWVNLIFCYINYGSEFTGSLHTAVSKMAIRERKTTVVNKLSHFNELIRVFIRLFPDQKCFDDAMAASMQHTSMATVYNVLLLDAKYKGLCIKTFHQRWREQITIFYEVFIQDKLVPESLIPLLVPEFKSSSSQPINSNVKHSIEGNAFNRKLITPIPLSYSDDKAKETVFESIKADIEHVNYHCENLVAETMQRFEKFHRLKAAGKVKRKTKAGTTGLGRGGNPVDMSLDENVCTTYAYHGWDSPVNKMGYLKFLGYQSRSDQLHKLLSLPTPYLLYPFLILLIKQHPAITDSWLLNWELYDNKGRLHGYKQVKGLWVIVSEKSRKGRNKAQQTITLNEKSGRLVKQIVQLTTMARDFLKAQNNDDYRYMLISQNGISSQPRRITKLLPLSNRNMVDSAISLRMQQESPHRSTTAADSIYQSLTCSTMRSSCGVMVYLETQSIHAMAEALGHEKYEPHLISHYLPKPLWDYFTNRWIRLFQNAIVYESMKESPNLLRAMDITADELDEYLRNHGLGDLPHHIKVGKEKAKALESENIFNTVQPAVIMVSTALLQVLFAIAEVTKTSKATEIFQYWLETASFILSHIESALDESRDNPTIISQDIVDMYILAKKNPLEHHIFQGATAC